MAKNKTSDGQMTLLDEVLYDERFLEEHAGPQVLHDPKTAVVELIANAWDAGATQVRIEWPSDNGLQRFSITDNGSGMTETEFKVRWRKLNYNRQIEQGATAQWPAEIESPPLRLAFGRNGIGRWSGFCFADNYTVDTSKSGKRNKFKVSRGIEKPFEIEHLIVNQDTDIHGTRIECEINRTIALSPEDARAEIGMRFLTDPNFRVSVNSEEVSFEHIDDPNIEKHEIKLPDGKKIELIVIDTQVTDRTTKQHGIAWHVGGRLVGVCSWRGLGSEDVIDGRRIAAKRYTFIVRANHLADAGAIKQDWSGFDKDNDVFQIAAESVYAAVRQHLLASSEEDRKQTMAKAREANRDVLKELGPRERETWTDFVAEAQTKCPSIKESDIIKLSEVVANLEHAKSGYALLHKLSEYGPDQLDELHELLEDWTLDMAKAVLDEIGRRLKLVNELQNRISDGKTKEVQELQPLFEKGLWIFGPEFETIEYTSNEGMTRVVQNLFKQVDGRGSRNRPDFAILPDGTCGLYAYPRYDSEGGEIGIDRLVVIELKKPGVKIGERQKAQCWKYVKELYEKGYLKSKVTNVRCFVLGSLVDDLEASPRTEMDNTVSIVPMLFDTVLVRAKSRLLKLHERVKDAPFLKEHKSELDAFLADPTEGYGLFAQVTTNTSAD